ncbi:hypothetical protein KC19_2G105500 [Ceratodon purpureus]|uniref:Uncharacterized protein n=1 Tax=Ceratodon purpureus TaxID=3225 RepID=A0A8T0IUZ0_CERPU|nr:hypothetical protein KC19_2G105500 [Ceratodon purpureus]
MMATSCIAPNRRRLLLQMRRSLPQFASPVGNCTMLQRSATLAFHNLQLLSHNVMKNEVFPANPLDPQALKGQINSETPCEIPKNNPLYKIQAHFHHERLQRLYISNPVLT